MKTYRITQENYIRHLWPYMLIVIFFPAIIYFLIVFRKGYFDLHMAIWVGSTFFLIYSIPLLLLHLNHYLRSKNDIFQYDNAANSITYDTNKEKVFFKVTDIQKITVVKSWPLARNDFPVLAWDYYHYAIIELKDGRQLKISSLLVYELDKVLKFENTEVKKTFYAWMS